MIQMVRALGVAAVVAASCLGGDAVAQTKQLTLCWAAWDPANALVELSKDFSTKTGIQMKYEFVPWTSYADQVPQRTQLKRKLCDVIIGDSQWIGGAARMVYTTSNSTILLPKKNLDGRFHAARWSAIPNGPRTLRTIGRCRRWATRSAGPIARLVRPAGNSSRIQEEIRARPRPAANLG